MEGYELDIFRHVSFEDKYDGLMVVLDNRFEEKQNRSLTFKHNNTLPPDDLVKLLDHAVCDQ